MLHKGFLIVGNWKMNPQSFESAKEIFSSISRVAKKARKTTVVIAPPAVFMSELGRKSGKSRAGRAIHLSAQDISANPEGAFTGSISARQMHGAGAKYAIIGHSEIRAEGDTNEIVAKKVAQALVAGLRVILCVGESERDSHGRYLQFVRAQLLSVFGSVDKKLVRWITVAYEPVWAIGKSYDIAPKPADIHEMSIYIKKIAIEVLGKKEGLKVPVLYGGSVDLENAKTILKDASIEGLLVGRQSLDSKAFAEIIKYANSI